MSIIDEIWVLHLQKVDTLLMIGIQDKYFHFIPVIYYGFIYLQNRIILFSKSGPQGGITFNSHDCLTNIKQHMKAKSVHKQ